MRYSTEQLQKISENKDQTQKKQSENKMRTIAKHTEEREKNT